MDLQDQIVQEYLATGCGYRKLQAKYGISRTTICKWVQIYQGIHDFAPTDLQQKHYISTMEREEKKKQRDASGNKAALQKKMAALEKQLAKREPSA